MAYVDAQRDHFGVEPICRVLSEHGAKNRPEHLLGGKEGPPRARAIRDEHLNGEIVRVWGENLEVYGANRV